MIEITCPAEMTKALEFALNAGTPQLAERLDYLATYGDGDNLCVIFPDCAPLSFGFMMLRPDGTRWFSGGLIYSGPGQPLDGSGPAFTVSIGINQAKHSWSVHT